MKIVESYNCEYCNKSYKDKNQTLKHEVKCKVTYEAGQERIKLVQERTKALANLRLQARSFDHFASLIQEAAKTYNNEDVEVKLDVYYSECIRNTHNKPINGKCNWEQKPNLPLGYPGFYGRIRMSKKKHSGHYCSDAISYREIPGLNTTSGGGGYDSEYGVELFVDDFPLIKPKVEQAIRHIGLINTFTRSMAERKQKIHDAKLIAINNDTEIIEKRALIAKLQSECNQRSKQIEDKITKERIDLMIAPCIIDLSNKTDEWRDVLHG